MQEAFKPKYSRVLIPNLVFFPFLIFNILSLGLIKNTKYKVDHKFITVKAKFMWEYQVDIPISQITNIDYTVGFFWDKIFSTGTIKIYTAGTGGADLYLNYIENVESVYDKLNDLLKLNKSMKIEKDGNENIFAKHRGDNDKLIQRVKPNAVFATVVITFFSFLFLFFIISFFVTILYNLKLIIDTNLYIYIIISILLFLIFLMISIVITYKIYKRKYFDFYEDKLEYYDGFLTLNKSTVPFERITNIEFSQTLFERIFEFYTINVSTAGTIGNEIKINWVKEGDRITKILKEVLNKDGRN